MDTSIDITFNAALLPAFGMPEDRLARVAARRAFVEIKASFIQATAEIPGPTGEMLQRKVRLASEVMDLWCLRQMVLAALPLGSPAGEVHRIELRRQLDSTFPEHDTSGTAFVDF